MLEVALPIGYASMNMVSKRLPKVFQIIERAQGERVDLYDNTSLPIAISDRMAKKLEEAADKVLALNEGDFYDFWSYEYPHKTEAIVNKMDDPWVDFLFYLHQIIQERWGE